MANKQYFQANPEALFADTETGEFLTAREWLEIQEDTDFPDSDFEALVEKEPVDR